MKKLIFVSLMICFLGCNEQQHKPKLFIPYSKINLSIIKFDSNYSIHYTLLNNGNGTLLIDTASSSCGCTEPILTSKRINPEDSAFLTVNYKPADTGYFNEKVVIKSNIDSLFSIVSFEGRAIK